MHVNISFQRRAIEWNSICVMIEGPPKYFLGVVRDVQLNLFIRDSQFGIDLLIDKGKLNFELLP